MCVCMGILRTNSCPKYTHANIHTHTHTHTYIAGENMKCLWHQAECRMYAAAAPAYGPGAAGSPFAMEKLSFPSST